jgi:hypothetical protein
MKKHIIIIALMAMFVCAFAQIGTHIPESRLPFDNSGNLEWTKAGCLAKIKNDGGMIIDKFLDVTEDLDGVYGNNISEKIENIVCDATNYYPHESLLLYFPPGEYFINETITVARDSVVFRGAGADQTTLKFNKYMPSDLYGNIQRYNMFDIIGSNDENTKYIGFENFKVEFLGPDIVNYGPIDEEGYMGMFFNFENSSYCWLTGVYSETSPRHHVYIKNSKYIEVRGCYFEKALTHTGGGNGYGIQLYGPEAKYVLIENNIFRKNRHAIVFNDEAKNNVVGYNYQRDAEGCGILGYPEGQLCFHGHNSNNYTGPEYNLCEGNIVCFMEIDDAHGTNGPYNTFFRNRAYKMGIQVEHENDDANIVNNYLKCSDVELILVGYPWIVHGNNHFKKNNKSEGNGIDWHDDESPDFLLDFSYYHDSRPDFIPLEQWPFDRINGSNPARDRWYNNNLKTVSIDQSHLLIEPDPAIISGKVILNNGNGTIGSSQIQFYGNGNNIVISPDSNGNYYYSFDSDYYGIYDITFSLYNNDQSLDSYYPVTISDIQLDHNTGSIELDDIVLNKINDYNIVVSSDGTNHNSFHRISSAIHYAQHYVFDKNITVAVLPGIYDEHTTISWNPDNLNLHIKLTGISTNNEDCILQNTRFLFGDGYGDNYNENDIIENFVFSNTKNSITILEGTPIIRNNTFVDCENETSDQYLHGGAIYCSSSAIIQQNIFTNTIANESLSEIGLGGAIYAETENTETITIANNEFNNCRSFGGGAIYCTGTGNFEINHNTFTQCSLIDGTFYPEEGLAVYSHTPLNEGQIEIVDNIFYNNISYNSDGEVVFIQTNSLTFRNNTVIDNNDCTGIRICTSNNAIVKNNLFSNNAVGISRNSNFSEPDITYTLASNNITNYQNCTPGIGCINNTSPELDNDFRPLWTSTQKSPCIDSGDPTETWDADGTPPDIGAVPAVNHRYDQVSLPPTTVDNGIKWLSFPALDVVRDSADIAENVLTDILDPNILNQLEASDYTIRYLSGSWENTDEQLTRTEGYKFKMFDAAQFDISGFKVPDNTKISLQSGSAGNWVGYWLEDTQSVFDALDGYLDDIYMVQAQHWSILKSGSSWLVTTDKGYSPTLSYADMAIIKCSTAIPKFTWNNSTPPEQPLEVAEPEYYTYSEQASYIPIFVELTSTQKELPDEIGAFVNGDCVGAAVVTDTLVMVPAYRSQGPIELEMYFADNKEKSSIANYHCYAAGNEAVVMEKLPDKLRAEAYVVSLDPTSELIPNTLQFSLENYPNPFNPTTTIFYTQPQAGSVSLEIFNIKGQKVRTLVNSHQASGSYQAVWNGRDDGGRQAASGIYFYKLQTPGYTTMKKMLLLK